MTEELKTIIDSACSLYTKFGIKSVTMDDVAKNLCISKKTLYKSVSDKTDLVDKAIYEICNKRHEMFTDIHKKGINAIEQLFEVYKAISYQLENLNLSLEYDLKKYYPNIYNKLITARREHIYRLTLENIEKGKREKLFRENLNGDIIAKFRLMQMENMFESDIFDEDERNSPAVFNEIFFYHLRGIASKKGLEIIEKLQIPS